MGTIASLRRKIEALDLEKVAIACVTQTKDAIVEGNRDQLFAGKLKSGEDIFPTYLDDPFFKTPEAAQRYSDWKDSIDPRPGKRKKGVPNLFITGAYVHDPLEVSVKGKDITFEIASPIGSNIFSKYGPDVTGLGGEFKAAYIKSPLRPLWEETITTMTGLKFKK